MITEIRHYLTSMKNQLIRDLRSKYSEVYVTFGDGEHINSSIKKKKLKLIEKRKNWLISLNV